MGPIGWRKRLRPSPDWTTATFWAIDVETTGLDVRRDQILSVGMVPIRDGVIRYGERFATLVRPGSASAPSHDGVGIHHILPGDVAAAPAFGAVVDAIESRLREGLVVMHHAPVDLAFLAQAYRDLGRTWPRVRVVDTLDLLMRLHHQRHHFTPFPPPLRASLRDARAEFGLAAHDAHDALSDAVATAELFLVLRSRLGVCTLRGLG